MRIEEKAPVRYELPFDDFPKLESHFHITFLYSIISGNIGDKYYPWICNQYVNCALDMSGNSVKFLLPEDDNGSMAINLTSYQFIELSKKTYREVIDIPLLFKNIISSGYYINGSFCAKSISDEYLCNSLDGKGDYVMTGYDDLQKVFILKGFNNHNKLKTFYVSYELFISVLLEIQRKVIRLHIWNFNSIEELSVDCNKLAMQLGEYINSSSNSGLKNRIYGVDAIKKLCDNIELQIYSKRSVDELFIKNIFEHKWFMFERIKYLAQMQYIDIKYMRSFDSIYHSFSESLSSLKKYNEAKDVTMSYKAIENIREGLNEEIECITGVINNLITYDGKRKICE